MKNHYKTLGLNQGVSQEEIQTAYERLSNELDQKKRLSRIFYRRIWKGSEGL